MLSITALVWVSFVCAATARASSARLRQYLAAWRCSPQSFSSRLVARERIRVLFWTSGGSVEKSALWLMDHEHIKPDHICLSCGQAMHLARTIPGSGGLTELRTYDCKACGVVFTESVVNDKPRSIDIGPRAAALVFLPVTRPRLCWGLLL
jgi:hypothetical protein